MPLARSGTTSQGAGVTHLPLEPDNPFWRFSLAVYAAPGVQPACLALQDGHGLDVNLALFCAWIGARRGIALTGAEIEAAGLLVAAWRETAVLPLRTLRRAIKAMPLPADPAIGTFRQRIAAAELEAEQLQQAMLFRWAEACWPGARGSGQAAANLRGLAARHGAADDAIALLADAAERVSAP